MRRRIGIAGMTGLGGNMAAHMMMNNWPTERRRNSLVRRCLKDAVDKYFTQTFTWGEGKFKSEEVIAWCDFGIDEDSIMIGQEPSYMYEHLKVVVICRKKEWSYIEQGIAWGGWGSQIASSRKYYWDYKYHSKFVKFVDRWHPILFGDQ